jgi:hypothetical protein
LLVTTSAERNEVFLCVVTRLTAVLLMMDVKVGTRATALAAPTIALEHLLLQLVILVRRQSQTTWLGKAHLPLDSGSR